MFRRRLDGSDKMILRRRWLLCVLVCMFCTGCETLAYYNQAFKGQVELLSNQRPLGEVIKDDNSPEQLKKQLSLIQDILAFAEQQLGLPVGGNFSHYVDTQRPYVVWNVFAADELSFKPKQWCYPIVGCASYRGYFKQGQAEAYADLLRAEGKDVYVGGIAAYSTLGWLDDPVLNTFVERNAMQLPALIFHELAHRILYVKGDTEFNESFASAVERIALERWLKHQNKPEAFSLYLKQKQRYDDFVEFVLFWKAQLEALYATDLSEEKKRQGKAELFKAMRSDYEQFKFNQQHYQGYDAWMSGLLNNAKLNTLATYQARVPAFLALYQQENSDFKKFIDACVELSRLKSTKRKQQVDDLMTVFLQ